MANPNSLDPSLWWDPFSLLLTELENASLSSDLPPNLVTLPSLTSLSLLSLSSVCLWFAWCFVQTKKLKDNHDWFVHTVSRFKPPNEKSREALNSSQQLKIGSHQLNIQPDLKDKALEISPLLVSSANLFPWFDFYQILFWINQILVCSVFGRGSILYSCPKVGREAQCGSWFYSSRVSSCGQFAFFPFPLVIYLLSVFRDVFILFHSCSSIQILLQYYIERQCLLKCTHRIIVHARKSIVTDEPDTFAAGI